MRNPKKRLRWLTLLCFAYLPSSVYAQDDSDIDESNVVYDDKKQSDNASTTSGNTSTQGEQPSSAALAPPLLLEYDLAVQERLLAKALPEDRVVWLMPNETPLLAVWHPEHSREPRGAALILPHQDITPAERSVVSNLQKHLAEHGWSNLTVGLPRSKHGKPPERPEPITPAPATSNQENTETSATNGEPVKGTPDNGSETAKNVDVAANKETTSNKETSGIKTASNETGEKNKEAASNPKETSGIQATEATAHELSIVRITAGLNYLQSQNQYNNVVIAIGSSAKRALDYATELTNKSIVLDTPPAGIRMSFPLRGMVLINVHHRLDNSTQKEVLESLSQLSIPVLDIDYKSHYSAASWYQEEFAVARDNAADIADIPVYIQRNLTAISIHQKGEQRLTKVIRGFLHRYAEGVEDEKR